MDQKSLESIMQFGTIDEILNLLKDQIIDSVNKFHVLTFFSPFQEDQQIKLVINQQELDKISDIDWAHMISNVENKLLKIDGTQVFIAKIVSNNVIFKCTKLQDTNELNNLIQQLNEQEQYDIVFITNNCMNININHLKIRYLNLISANQQINLTLQHPECLVSLSIYNVQIYNIKDCINLQNINTSHYSFYKKNLKYMRNIKRLHSYSDQYDGYYETILAQLFHNNMLEYVYIDGGSDMLETIEIRKNIRNMRVFSIYNKDSNCRITLNISEEQPQNLYVYDVQISYMNIAVPAKIEGPQNLVEVLQTNFLQEIQSDESEYSYEEVSEDYNLIAGDGMIL